MNLAPPESSRRKRPDSEGLVSSTYSVMWCIYTPGTSPGKTEAERFDNAVRKVFSVSKAAYLKEEARKKRAKKKVSRAN